MASLNEIYQEPSNFYQVNKISQLYGPITGSVVSPTKPFWNDLGINMDNSGKVKPIVYNQEIPIRTNWSIVNGYQPSIIRPFDSVHLPTDLKRTTFCKEEKCNGPCYAGAKSQVWCSEDNAINYHAMRPLVTPDKYNEWLQKMFDMLSTGDRNYLNNLINSEKWTAIFCSNSREMIMTWLMNKVAEAVEKIPEMHKNGPYKVEQFFWTDADIYMTKENYQSQSATYNVIFNLYNPLRSVSTYTQAILDLTNGNDLSIKYIGFVSTLDWKLDGVKVDGISGFNFSTTSGQNKQISLNTGSNPTIIDWNYGNTLLKQEFNEYGFYNENDNIKVEAGVSEKMKKCMDAYQENEGSYLMGCTTVKFTGLSSDNHTRAEQVITKSNGIPHNVYDNPSIIYNAPVTFENKNNNLSMYVPSTTYNYPLIPIGYVDT
jgi:hypothetical protein